MTRQGGRPRGFVTVARVTRFPARYGAAGRGTILHLGAVGYRLLRTIFTSDNVALRSITSTSQPAHGQKGADGKSRPVVHAGGSGRSIRLASVWHRNGTEIRECSCPVHGILTASIVIFQGFSLGHPRSGRGGRRFKSCHSDQYLAQFPTRSANASAKGSRDGCRTVCCSIVSNALRQHSLHAGIQPSFPC
jgi:hypothetical protein